MNLLWLQFLFSICTLLCLHCRLPINLYIVGKDCEEEYIVARSEDEALGKAQEKYGKDAKIYQEPDVLDTWFSSALWPFSTLGWPDESIEDFKRFYPTTMLETGSTNQLDQTLYVCHWKEMELQD
nr:valine--tRNA ligase, chloroplastic/mitochondrial 2-like [Malus domestica]